MDAKRLILETDGAGNLKHLPKLPPNQQFEAIFLAITDVNNLPPTLLNEGFSTDLTTVSQTSVGLTSKPSVEEIMALATQFFSLPEFDSRDADEILGYDKYGLPS
ncbi:MAG: hypothetical protein ACFCVB_17860 [Nodosilinea sp.]